MPQITFITAEGASVVTDAASGSLMEAATAAGVPGIGGDCGGVCSCATCHVHVSPEWREKVGPPDEIEAGVLAVQEHFTPQSRLACQIDVTPALDGLVVHVPNS